MVARKLFSWGIVGFPFFFLLLPIDYFDSGESICLSVVFFDIECYACGMTRAMMHLIHLDFSGAWHFNPLAFPTAIVFGIIWVKHALVISNQNIPFWMQKHLP